jgi:hypothetical protein
MFVLIFWLGVVMQWVKKVLHSPMFKGLNLATSCTRKKQHKNMISYFVGQQWLHNGLNNCYICQSFKGSNPVAAATSRK